MDGTGVVLVVGLRVCPATSVPVERVLTNAATPRPTPTTAVTPTISFHERFAEGCGSGTAGANRVPTLVDCDGLSSTSGGGAGTGARSPLPERGACCPLPETGAGGTTRTPLGPGIAGGGSWTASALTAAATARAVAIGVPAARAASSIASARSAAVA